MRQDRWFLPTLAAATALILLLWVGAMSPHLVHHLFDVDEALAQTCLMSEQAGQFPCLVVMQPSLALPNTPQLAFPALPVLSPLKPCAVNGLSRAPPFIRT
jgi:hypothetical protein